MFHFNFRNPFKVGLITLALIMLLSISTFSTFISVASVYQIRVDKHIMLIKHTEVTNRHYIRQHASNTCFFCTIWNWVVGKHDPAPSNTNQVGSDTACFGVTQWQRDWAVVYNPRTAQQEKQWLDFWHPTGICFGFSW